MEQIMGIIFHENYTDCGWEPPDRTKDYRIVCRECKRDFGGTFGAKPGHAIREILCAACEFGSPEAHWKIITDRLRKESGE